MAQQQHQQWRLILFAAFVLFGLFLAVTLELPTLEQLRSYSVALGPWAVVVFALFYVGVTQFPIPRTALTVSSGVLFGPAVGIGVALASTTVAAAVSLTLLRRLIDADPSAPTTNQSPLKRWAARRGEHPTLAKINARLEHRGWFSILCLRLIPGLPFSLLNYACVFAPIRRRDFVIGTFIGSAPSTIIGVLLGDSLTDGDGQRAMILLAGLGLVGLVGLCIDLLLPVKANA